MPRRWLASEPGPLSGLRQAAALCRVSLGRPWLLLSLSSLFAAVLVVALFIVKQSYSPVFVMRVVEADRDQKSMPRLKRHLAEYARQAVMTSEPLVQLMRKHGLYASLLRKNQRAALESFREDVSIQVYQNFFLEDRAPGERPRSARMTVSYSAKDPVLALQVTRDLGALIIGHEQRVRREQASLAAREAAFERDGLERVLEQRSSQIVARQAELASLTGPDSRAQVELIGLLGSLSGLERDLDAAARRAAELELEAAFEQRGMGLSFQVVDDGALPSRAGRIRNLVLAFAAFSLAGLPLVALTLGAFLPQRGRS